MKIKLTPRAQRRVKVVGAWWREHRPNVPDLFAEELAWAKNELLSRPYLAPIYAIVEGRVFRRLLLPKTEQHVYYVVDKAADLVIVHTIWGARRGRGPRL